MDIDGYFEIEVDEELVAIGYGEVDLRFDALPDDRDFSIRVIEKEPAKIKPKGDMSQIEFRFDGYLVAKGRGLGYKKAGGVSKITVVDIDGDR